MIPHGYAQRIIIRRRWRPLRPVAIWIWKAAAISDNLDPIGAGRERCRSALINDAVRRILRKKFEMGLFDDPFRFCNKERERREWNNRHTCALRKMMAEKSIVLLKNEKSCCLCRRIRGPSRLIGPLVKSVRDNMGFWSYSGRTIRRVSSLNGRGSAVRSAERAACCMPKAVISATPHGRICTKPLRWRVRRTS